MSDAIATIPNYCSYKTFKTGFAEGLGICYNEDSLSCGKTNPSKIRVHYHGIERTGDCTYLVIEQPASSYMRGKTGITELCDWFDAYSVSHKYSKVLKGRKCDGMTSYQVDDHHQEIEDILSERLQSASQSFSDSGLSGSRNSTAKSWKRRIDKECFRYSKEKGCIDWLETNCHNQGLKKTNSDRELIKSFKEQLLTDTHLGGDKLEDTALKLNYFVFSKPGMLPACTHLKRKFGTDSSSCEDVRALNSVESGEGTLEEEVFDDELYYLGVPVSKICNCN